MEINKILDTFPPLTVSELNHEARALLEAHFPYVWVEGEISNLVAPASGHLYFSLKDANAQVRAAMFRGANQYLPFMPKNGQHVKVRARVTLYVVRGEFQLVVEKMEEAGEGLLRQKFEALKAALAQEGLFDGQRKKTLPKFPNTLGVITSPTGAVIQDILNILKRRFSYAKVILYPTQVQGSMAAAQIREAIQVANRRHECDCLIVARGGGSLEDLWPFNEEVVARAIFESRIPIVSGVGHETDVTIADFVADVRAPTPSAAAELVCPATEEWLERIILHKNRVVRATKSFLERYREHLQWLCKSLKHPAYRIQECCERCDEMTQQLFRAWQALLTRQRMQYEMLLSRMSSLNPLATLERGYAIITRPSDQKVLYRADEVKVGGQIHARLAVGMLGCQVQTVEETRARPPHHSMRHYPLEI
ncbi:MAG: exodeoxyribonuclease VII large subunit [Gammaproteobacteria bacterium]|nr:exodeoxyribonuclease VII large subunit [Gammaproteobacteria bacterium]